MHIFIISTQWNWLFLSVQWHLQQRHANRTHSFLFSSSRKTRFCTKKKFFRQFADERARKSSLRRVYEFKWVLSKSHSKAILIQNNMHLSLFLTRYNISPTSSGVSSLVMRTRWNRCSHIRFECFVLTQKNTRKLSNTIMASLKPTRIHLMPASSAMKDARVCKCNRKRFITIWANAVHQAQSIQCA